MKKLVILTYFLCSFAYTQDVKKINKPVTCAKLDDMVAYVVGEKSEEIVLQSLETDNSLAITLFANLQTQTWTLIESNRDTACILSAGRGLRFKLNQKGSHEKT